MIAAGLISVDEQLVAEHAGHRYTASFSADGDITMDGHAPWPHPAWPGGWY